MSNSPSPTHDGDVASSPVLPRPTRSDPAARYPPDFHPFVGNVASMAASTATIVAVLSVIPGFG
ncbi:hypothetical protein [Mycobacterium sp. URHD0025]|uniref:hypothetical protein n=1 Tax=Mycobacterium sp. URHD0025 TaxID=1298864 RepID=UPI0012DC147C|nr:hypothetical protein [Mycobacterium sp. URHD0025]